MENVQARLGHCLNQLANEFSSSPALAVAVRMPTGQDEHDSNIGGMTRYVNVAAGAAEAMATG
jgi:hypothetical protein